MGEGEHNERQDEQAERAEGKRGDSPQMRLSDDVSLYKEQSQSRYALDHRLRTTVVLLVVALALVPAGLILPTHLFDAGGVNTSMAQYLQSLGGRIQAASQIGQNTAAGRAMAIYFWELVAVAIVGAGLALNGAVYQGSMKNALASPSTLGVMSGATLGSIAYTILVVFPDQEVLSTQLVRVSELSAYLDSLDPIEYFLTAQQRVLFTAAGSFIVVGLVLAISFAAGRGRVSKVGLLVAGQVFTAVAASITEMIRFYIRDHGTEGQMTALRSAVGGSFDNMWNVYQVAYLAVPILIGIVIIMLVRNRLNLLAFDDDEVRAMGVNPNRTRYAVIIVCTVLTAVIVAFVGSVGFVGFIVPHIARKMVGPDFRYFIPASICLGAIYLLVSYCLMNMTGILMGSVGTFTSLIGVVFFAIMAVRQRARGNVDWI